MPWYTPLKNEIKVFTGRAIDYKKIFDILLIFGLVILGALFFIKVQGGDGVWKWNFFTNLIIQKSSTEGWQKGLLIQGFIISIQLSFWIFIFAMALGFFFGSLRSSSLLPLKLLARSYVLFIRNIPPLVLVFIFYFFLGSLISQFINWYQIQKFISTLPGYWVLFPKKGIEAFFTAVFALSLYQGAFISEIVRAGIETVPKSQQEASAALGMSGLKTLIYITLPQAWRVMLPPLVSQVSMLIKNSSLAAVITIPELVNIGRLISDSSSNFFEVWVCVAFLYFMICTFVTRLGAWLEKKAAYSKN